MKSDEMVNRAKSLAQDGKRVCVFGKSCIYAENYDSAMHIVFFDYDTPIFDIYVHDGDEYNRYAHPYKLQGWRFSATTTKHTKIALDIAALAIYSRYGIDIEPDTMFTVIDNDNNKFYI